MPSSTLHQVDTDLWLVDSCLSLIGWHITPSSTLLQDPSLVSTIPSWWRECWREHTMTQVVLPGPAVLGHCWIFWLYLKTFNSTNFSAKYLYFTKYLSEYSPVLQVPHGGLQGHVSQDLQSPVILKLQVILTSDWLKQYNTDLWLVRVCSLGGLSEACVGAFFETDSLDCYSGKQYN